MPTTPNLNDQEPSLNTMTALSPAGKEYIETLARRHCKGRRNLTLTTAHSEN